MTQKRITTVGWVLTIILGLLFAMSAFMKLTQNEAAVAQAAAAGFDGATYQLIGVVELLALILFLIPRTGLVGSLLLIAYMGGAIATHLQHQQPIVVPIILEVLIWATTAMCYPEVLQKLLPGKPKLIAS